MGRRRASRAGVKVVKRKGKPFLVLRWRDPETNRWRERATSTTRRRVAEREAADLEAQLDAGVVDSGEILWHKFRWRYEQEHLASLAKGTLGMWRTSANWLEDLVHLNRLGDVNTALLSRFAAKLRAKGKPETTIAAYLRHIRSALNWAEEMGLIAKAPRVMMPKRARGVTKHMRSRPITGEEFDRVLAAAKKVRPDDFRRWQQFLKGLNLTGFRVDELLQLSWNPGATWSIDCSHAIPLIRLVAEGEKAHRDRFQPITPEFWQLCLETPESSRRGYVLPLPGKNGQMTVKRVIRVIGSIGKRAGVITNPTTGKFATSSDIGRRAFATRLGQQISQAELAEWMRHASPQTTMQFYHATKAIDLAERVWQQKGDPVGDPGQNTPEEVERG